MSISPVSRRARCAAGFTCAALLALAFVACGVRPVPNAKPNANPNPDPRLAQADGAKPPEDGEKPDDVPRQADGAKPADGARPSDKGKKSRDGGKKADGGRGFIQPDDEPLDKDKEKDKADEKDKDGDAPKRQARKDGEARRLAVLVGLDGYDSKDFSDLRYAEKDVEELGKLLAEAGYHKDDVVVLTGKRGEEDASKRPTVANVRKALAAATKGMGEKDVLVVALAGHGIEPAKGEHSYCAFQAKKVGEGKFTGLLPISEVYEQLGKAKGALKLLLVDACRNDPNGRGLSEIDGGFDTVTAPPPSRNTIAFYSCSPGERSWEPGELKHGLFMYHLLQGLRDKADYFQDGKITWQNAVSFTDREVRSYSKNALRKLQQPHFKGEARGEVPPLVVWEGRAKEKPPQSEEEKKAFGFLQVNEDFARSTLGGRPTKWDGPDVRVATDKQNRRCLEAIGNSGQKEVTLPRVNLSGDFFIEIEYLLDGYSNAETDVHRMTVVMEGREGADRVKAEVDHAGRSTVGSTDRRRPENYVNSRENPTKGPHKVTTFRLEREGRVYRVLLNDEFTVGGEQTFSGDFDTVRVSLTAGVPVNNYTLRDRARLYSVKVGTMKPATDKKTAVVEAPKEGKPFAMDFRKAKLAGLPEGWQGPDFYVATDKENRRCLEAKGEDGLKALALPRFALKGDFLIEIDAVLDGYGKADKDVHDLVVALQGGNAKIHFRIDHAGRTSIGLVGSTEPRIPHRFKPYQVFRQRCEREGNVYRASVNDVPAVGARIDYTGDIDVIDLGLTAGVPKSNHTLRQRARIYSVKVATVKPGKREGKPEQPEGGVKEDFRWYKAGELPEGWQASRASNLAVQPGPEKSGLELTSKIVLSDTVLLPKLELPGPFVASFECEVHEKESYVALALGGNAKNSFTIGLLGEKKLAINNGKPVDVAKQWKEGGPQLLQVERTAQQFRIKLNDQEIGAIPLGRGGGAFVQGAVTLRVKDKKDPTPRVTAVRIAPLK